MKYKDWINNQKCLCHTNYAFECNGDVCGHHVKTKGMGGKRNPEFDYKNLVPLCHKHHMYVHNKGKKAFFNRYSILLEETAVKLYDKWASIQSIIDRYFAYSKLKK